MLLFYDAETGLVRRFLHSGDGSEDTGPWVQAEVADPWSVYVWQGAVHPLPPKPGDWATFDPATATWLDRRSAAQRAADLERAKAAAIARVNGWASRERARHITAIPGQDMIYLAKEAEAIRWLAADPAPADLTAYPLLAAEIGITAETPDQLAQLWVHLGQIWRGLAAGIETQRLGTIKAITEAGDEDGVSAALATLPNAG